MPRPRMTPGEEPARLRIKVPGALLDLIERRMKESREANKSAFLRKKIEEIFSDSTELYKQACRDLIWLFDKFVEDPTADTLDKLLDQLDSANIDKAKVLLRNE